MATLEDLPDRMRINLTTLFSARNYCFATHEAMRTPTFYFSMGGPQRLQFGRPNGRIRTMHGHGPLIEVCSTPKQHWFFKTKADRDAARLKAKACKDKLKLVDLAKTMRKKPKKGYFHYEFLVGPTLSSGIGTGHRSGGKVDLTRIPSNDTFEALLNHMLSAECVLQIDKTKVKLVEGVTRPSREEAPRSMRAFLDGLG